MEETKQIKIDKTDKDIINTLLDNSRLSYRQIAKKINKSAATVMNRVKKLEDSGIIKKYTANIDYEKIGYEFPVMIDLRISKGEEINSGYGIAKSPNVCAIYDITGAFDLSVTALFKTRKQLDEFIKRLPKQNNVERSHTRLIINTLKEENIKIT